MRVKAKDVLKIAQEEPTDNSDKVYLMNKTYDIVTPESAEAGDFADQGFVYEDEEFDSLEELAREILSEGSVEPSDYPIVSNSTWYSTVDSVQDRDYFEEGESKTYAFHPKGLTDQEAKELYRLIKGH